MALEAGIQAGKPNVAPVVRKAAVAVPRVGVAAPAPVSTPAPGAPAAPASPAPPVFAPPAPITNTAERDPTVGRALENVNRFTEGTPEYAGKLMETAAQKTRDAGEGVLRGIGESAARRGIAGSGVEGILRRREGERQLAAIAGQNRDIELGQHANEGALLAQAGNLALGAQANQQAQQRVGLDTYRTGLEAANQGFNQLLALSNQYQQQAPKAYYDDSDPASAYDAEHGGTGGVNPGAGTGKTAVVGARLGGAPAGGLAVKQTVYR